MRMQRVGNGGWLSLAAAGWGRGKYQRNASHWWLLAYAAHGGGRLACCSSSDLLSARSALRTRLRWNWYCAVTSLSANSMAASTIVLRSGCTESGIASSTVWRNLRNASLAACYPAFADSRTSSTRSAGRGATVLFSVLCVISDSLLVCCFAVAVHANRPR